MLKFGYLKFSRSINIYPSKLTINNLPVIQCIRKKHSEDKHGYHDPHDTHDHHAVYKISDFHEDIKPSHYISLDDVYSPSFNWKEHQAKRSARFDKYLIGSIIWFGFACYIFYKFDVLKYSSYAMPEMKNTPEGLAFYEYARKFYVGSEESENVIDEDSKA